MPVSSRTVNCVKYDVGTVKVVQLVLLWPTTWTRVAKLSTSQCAACSFFFESTKQLSKPENTCEPSRRAANDAIVFDGTGQTRAVGSSRTTPASRLLRG